MDLKKFSFLPFYTIDQEWALLTAGDQNKFNTMTISWGGLGTIWNEPIVIVYVKPTRYTYEFIESSDYFTVSFYEKKYQKDLVILGTKSGRDTDKIAQTKLTPHFLEKAISFQEACLTLVCQKIYFQDLKEENIIPGGILQREIDRFYQKEPIHRMYFGKVVEIIDNRTEEERKEENEK